MEADVEAEKTHGRTLLHPRQHREPLSQHGGNRLVATGPRDVQRNTSLLFVAAAAAVAREIRAVGEQRRGSLQIADVACRVQRGTATELPSQRPSRRVREFDLIDRRAASDEQVDDLGAVRVIYSSLDGTMQ